MAQNIEKRGLGLNESRHMKQFIALRNGELKFFDSDTLKLLGSSFLHEKLSCTVINRRLQLTATFPSPSNHVFKFSNDRELLSWYDAIKESQKIEQRKQTRRLNSMRTGVGVCIEGNKGDKRVVWLDGNLVKWAKNKSSECDNISLSKVTKVSYTNLRSGGQGIVMRDSRREIAFSTIQEGEAKDLYLAIQWLVAAKNPNAATRLLSESGFYYRRLQLKILQKAEASTLEYSEYLKAIVRSAIASMNTTEEFPVNPLLGTSRNQMVRKYHCRSYLPLQTSYCQPDKKSTEIMPNSICVMTSGFNKENFSNNPPEESFSVTNIEPEALNCSNSAIGRQRPMCEQSFSVDASWEIPHSKISPREKPAQELEGQCTSRFRDIQADDFPPQNTDENQIAKLKERIQELTEENANNKMLADYWRNQFTQTTQSLDEWLCELSELKTHNNKLTDELSKLREENSTLVLELECVLG
eukprot:TRINITY_DN7725_c0_g2_i2.p1 TRINITY_DN7725_c0_g2~~TRINITY_DN7725_c0_g2_i2.p1  ORF type:complete len:469 (-),score=109.30 TRINITY_DN7725_c0_g2_i2:545-1951(-)